MKTVIKPRYCTVFFYLGTVAKTHWNCGVPISHQTFPLSSLPLLQIVLSRASRVDWIVKEPS